MTGGVQDLHARQEAQLDRLLRQGKDAGDNRLRGDHCRQCREGD